MNREFDKDTLEITLRRSISKEQDYLILDITSDYDERYHKSKLYVNKEALAKKVEDTWKSIKTKMLQSMCLGFDTIDWYDDMTDMYETPIIRIQRGLKRAKISYNEHGSIPKDWSISVTSALHSTNVITPFIEVAKAVLGSSLFDKEFEEKFTKKARLVLQKKQSSITVYKHTQHGE